jgi:hypothetical protein
VPERPRKLTQDEAARVREAALKVWHAIAHDIFQAYPPGKLLYRAHVIELVADTGIFNDELKRAGLSDEARALVWNRNKESLIQLLRPAFPHSQYGN